MSEPLVESAQDALRRALGALLLDVDVTSAHAVERGAVEVTRRGKKERLGVALPDELFEALRALGAGTAAVELLVDGHRVRALPAPGDRVLLSLEKRPSLDARLSSLVEEGMVPPDAAIDMLALARAGHGLVVVGVARAGAQRLVAALARELSESAATMSLDDDSAADWLLPPPRTPGDVTERARACALAGAEVLVSLGLSLSEARALASAELPGLIVAVVEVANAPAYQAAFRRGSDEGPRNADALATQLCVVGRGPAGRPLVVEHHMPASAASSSSSSPPLERAVVERPASGRPAPERSPAEPQILERAPPEPGLPSAARVLVEDGPEPLPLQPLGSGPPGAWASTSLDDDPGWELGDPKEGPSAFDGVLAEVKARPTYTPRPPPAHPQTRALRGDPFGGLTLEPPGGSLEDEDATVTSDGAAGRSSGDEDER